LTYINKSFDLVQLFLSKKDISSKLERRSFLSRLGLGISGALFFPLHQWGITKTSEISKIILRTRPLGFQWETQDPFLFCVHHEDYFPKGNPELGPDPKHFEGRHIGQDFIIKDGFRMYHGSTVPGFPGHPHRGFETITVVRKGLVDHADSLGAAGRYGNGDVQWMTAGKGVQHAEMFPLLNQDAENPLELFQIWLNLPKRSKMVDPHFKMLWSESVPKFSVASNGANAHIEVLVGSLGQYRSTNTPPNSWAADENNHVAIYNIHFEAGASFELPAVGQDINRSIYYYEGNGLQIGDQSIAHYHAADVDAAQHCTLINGAESSKVLVLQGRPISEAVVQHGPFVMNSKEEIYQAFQDYQITQFGGWPWPGYDQVHDAKLGRFAKHADGRIEEPKA
jgi:redox-sensitive bicupin YhaK (pirin superfamily)